MLDTDRGLLIKILPESHVESFMEGKLYCNTNAYFSKIDSTDQVRFDPDEGIDESRQVKEIAIQDKSTGEYIPIGGVISPVKYRSHNQPALNVFCVYVLLEREDFQVDQRIQEFGEHAVVIRNPKEFTRRVRSAAANNQMEAWQMPIHYVEKRTYDGEMGPFRKYDTYSYQSEFRYVFAPGSNAPLTLDIGCIRDICRIIPSSEIALLKEQMAAVGTCRT